MIFYENKSSQLYCWLGCDMTFPLHIHKELEIMVVKKGEIEVTINSVTRLLHEGDISFALPNSIHSYKSYSPSEHLMIIFNGDMLPLYKNIFTTCRACQTHIPASLAPEDAVASLDGIYREVHSGNNPGTVTGHLYILVSRLLPLMDLRKIRKDISGELIERLLNHIQLNYLNPISLNSIAAELNISPYRISRLFSNNIGLRLDKYINELRISYANHLLISSDKPITEIAFECGFDTLRTFNRAYKAITAVTPREYRRSANVQG